MARFPLLPGIHLETRNLSRTGLPYFCPSHTRVPLLCTGIRDKSRCMKQTRKITISERVFTAQDLMRIAGVLYKHTHDKGKNHVTTEFEVTFSDNTRFESETPEVFQEESLTAHGRPVAIAMSYRDYTRSRFISLSLSQGESS